MSEANTAGGVVEARRSSAVFRLAPGVDSELMHPPNQRGRVQVSTGVPPGEQPAGIGQDACGSEWLGEGLGSATNLATSKRTPS